MRRVLFFLNPLLMERRNRRAAVDRVADMLRETGCTVELQDTLSAHSAGEQAQEAVTKDLSFICNNTADPSPKSHHKLPPLRVKIPTTACLLRARYLLALLQLFAQGKRN